MLNTTSGIRRIVRAPQIMLVPRVPTVLTGNVRGVNPVHSPLFRLFDDRTAGFNRDEIYGHPSLLYRGYLPANQIIQSAIHASSFPGLQPMYLGLTLMSSNPSSILRAMSLLASSAS